MATSLNAINCEAGDAAVALSVDGAKADVTTVVGEEYRIFAPCHGITVIGTSDPATVGNVLGVIGPGGWLDWRATATTLMIAIVDTAATKGTSFDATAYVVKLSNVA
jgi:hypothetical protein